MKKLLMHACCGPCFAYIEQDLRLNGLLNDNGEYEKVEYKAFFYNPNIHPKVEHKRRLESFKMLCEKTGCDYIIQEDYDMYGFVDDVAIKVNEKKLFEKRCEYCYYTRLKKAFEYAKENSFDIVSTTLTISPYQAHDIIQKVGNRLEKEFNIEFRYVDYTSHYREGKKIAFDMGLYMQKYCGCVFSMDSGKWVY